MLVRFTPPGGKNAIIAALLLLCTIACAPMSAPLKGELSGDLVWEGNIYIGGDLVLKAGSRLTIAPGTTVRFLPPGSREGQLTEHPNFPGSELIVRGSLIAEGTPSAPITFRYIDPSAPAGSWGGINLADAPEASFRYCRFTQAESALHSQQSLVRVEQSLFEENIVAIRFHSSDFLIEHNLLRRNGTAIRFHFGSPVIRGNDLRQNGKGFFVTSHPREYRIEGNNIVASTQYSVVLGEEVPEDFHMAGNYWGTRDPGTVGESIFDGRRDGNLGRVLFLPAAREPIEGAGISWNP